MTELSINQPIKQSFIYSVNGWLFFVLIIIVQWVVTFINTEFILSEALYIEAYSDIYSLEQLSKMLALQENLVLANYLFPIVYYPFKFLIVSMAILTGLYFCQQQVKFSHVFKVVMIAEAVFLVRLMYKSLYFWLFAESYTLQDFKQFYPFSITSFDWTLPTWLVYPLSMINVFEAVYVLCIYMGLKAFVHYIDPRRLGIIVGTTYATYLFLLMLLSAYLNIING